MDGMFYEYAAAYSVQSATPKEKATLDALAYL
jgi:hypothetical protein